MEGVWLQSALGAPERRNGGGREKGRGTGGGRSNNGIVQVVGAFLCMGKSNGQSSRLPKCVAISRSETVSLD